jgi:hypothetical protein
MKKIGEKKTSSGVVEYFQDENGSITTAKPISNVLFKKWIVTDDPSQYTMGKVFDSEKEAMAHKVKMHPHYVVYIIELSYISDDLPPQYIHAINDDGSKVRIL